MLKSLSKSLPKIPPQIDLQEVDVPATIDRSTFLSTLPATSTDRAAALTIVGISSILFAMAAPFAGISLLPVPAFVASYQSALAVSDIVTAALMAAAQRPVTDTALNEKSGEPAWKKLPSWFVYGTGDKNIPAAALAFMAERAGSKRTIVVEGASHVVMVSQPQKVADLVEEAAK